MTDSASCQFSDLAPTNVECPECGKGKIIPARGRFGPIWVCETKPACKFWMRSRPTGDVCRHDRPWGKCGNLMMEGTKTIPDRCSDTECPNYRPPRRKQPA